MSALADFPDNLTNDFSTVLPFKGWKFTHVFLPLLHWIQRINNAFCENLWESSVHVVLRNEATNPYLGDDWLALVLVIQSVASFFPMPLKHYLKQ